MWTFFCSTMFFGRLSSSKKPRLFFPSRFVLNHVFPWLILIDNSGYSHRVGDLAQSCRSNQKHDWSHKPFFWSVFLCTLWLSDVNHVFFLIDHVGAGSPGQKNTETKKISHVFFMIDRSLWNSNLKKEEGIFFGTQSHFLSGWSLTYPKARRFLST